MTRRTQRPFWSTDPAEMLARLGATPAGLTNEEALARRRTAAHSPWSERHRELLRFLGQLNNPIILLLLFAAGLSFFLRDATDAMIILFIIFASASLSWWQERGAADAVRKLLALVQVEIIVLRDGEPASAPAEEIVPGDVLQLSVGSTIPADCLLLQCQDLFIDEAALTGETYPVEKRLGVVPADAPIAQRSNSLFSGTHVVSGTGTAVAVLCGEDTEFGHVAARLRLRPPETDFERGVRRFGYLIMEVTLVLLLVVFAVNVFFERPVIEAFLFSLALAVGLTPQMLPAIISVNLAQGAKRMALEKVIVRRLSSIENFGAMNVLCSDKTGTLTEGRVDLHSAIDANGAESEKVLLYAYVNAKFETGFVNPIDEAIRNAGNFDIGRFERLDEIPYDFGRKRLSIIVRCGEERLMITKGALASILEVCESAETASGVMRPLADLQEALQRRFEDLSAQGLRTLGVAYRKLPISSKGVRTDEAGMVFLGLLILYDPPKTGIVQTLSRLRDLGISVKVITGDNRLVATSVGASVGIADLQVLTGPELRRMSDEALRNRASGVDIFAEVEPNQKERIIRSLQKAGCVVGFLGDGINDASALHAADVGISVGGAVDVAKEAADMVLLEHDLDVLVRGVREGRATFANTLKYVHMATSANFGNMFSMAGASLFLPFLPLLPKQVLLTNLLTDLPEMTIGTDLVDEELIAQPRRWDIRFIRRFMFVFGLVSTMFDYMTFGALLFVLHSTTAQFRTAWFVESVISASLAVLVIRSRKPFFRSRPSLALVVATLLITIVTLLLPLSPLASLLALEPLPRAFLVAIGLIILLYLATAEMAKRVFYAREVP